MELILIGHSGQIVTTIQQRLKAAGYNIDVDGDFGPQTDTVVREFQRDRSLIDDGVVGPKTMAALQNQNTQMFLGNDHIAEASKMLDIDTASVHAVLQVESRGNGFLPDGRVVILFERHIMRRRLLANGFHRSEVAKLCTLYPGLINTTPGGYRGMAAEHYRLTNATKIHTASALESCSWGLFQIMGFHWQNLGFDSVEDFVAFQRISEANQLATFVRFIQAHPPMWEALKAQDWATFARLYNGPGYKKHHYDTRLADGHAQHLERAA